MNTYLMYRIFIKSMADFIFAILLILLLLPLIIGLIIIISASNMGSPFFIQPRPGKHGNVFMLVKFKTMNDKKDKSGNLLPDSKRLSKLGRIIRKFSLDELPQLINVLKGEMSFIGPRPLLVRYLPLYNDEQKRRHEVKPGITGWAQVNGRNSISWEEKFKLDVWYVDNVSFLLDLKIVFLTIKKILIREGINQCKNRTMEPFYGSLNKK